ncbi:hypothetical protein, partial [Filibacter tadaridae]|uniref:hypothetical protein n=1 Tax=Filibacter tadaridae TaxID=2483811 RepID=UPI0019398E46
ITAAVAGINDETVSNTVMTIIRKTDFIHFSPLDTVPVTQAFMFVSTVMIVPTFMLVQVNDTKHALFLLFLTVS